MTGTLNPVGLSVRLAHPHLRRGFVGAPVRVGFSAPFSDVVTPTVAPAPDTFLLLEDGFFLLLEDGFKLVLE